MTTTGPPALTVTGGVDGVAAHRLEVRALAGALEQGAGRVAGVAGRAAAVLVQPALAAGALVAPVSHARVVALLLALEVGPDALPPAAAALAATALAVREALAGLELADEAAAAAATAGDLALLAGALPLVPLLGAVALVDPGTAGDLAQGAVTAEPVLVDGAVDGLAALLPTAAHGVPGAAALVVMAAGCSRAPGHAVPRGDLAVAGGAPASLAELAAHLGAVAGLARDPADRGTIEVQTLHGPGGTRHVVYLPGTDDILGIGARQDADARDLGADLQLVAGERTAYADGVRAALVAARVRPGEPVLLAGHSQGGLLASALLHEGVALPGGAATLAGAVVLGAPIAHQGPPPAGTTVLALENRHDVVPHLDGAPNPDAVGLVTVTGDGGGHDVLAAHEFPAYGTIAAAADATDDPSVRAELATLRAAGFLRGPEDVATSQVFQVTREPR